LWQRPLTNYLPQPERYDEVFGPDGRPRPHWKRLVEAAARASRAELSRRAETIRHAVEQDGVTYNIYADPKGADRPWEVDLLPLIISTEEWRFLAQAVQQRARLLNAVLADLYGPGRLLAEGLLPPAIIHGHHNYLWPCRGLEPPGGTFLNLYGCDLARSPDGRWWVIADRTQGPSGAGYAVQNRLIVTPMYGRLFRSLGVQRLAGFFRTLQQRLAAWRHRRRGAVHRLDARAVQRNLLRAGFLARYLGFARGRIDLTVRDNRLY
jgi:uncharacterized circularly permuted ATP-grasp superfamily protein